MNTIPKYGKIQLKIITLNKHSQMSNTEVLTFDDCGLMITGDYIVVVIDEKDELKNSVTSTGKIFPLKNVIEYKTHKI